MFLFSSRDVRVTSSIISLTFLCMMVFNFPVLVSSTFIFIIPLVLHS